MLKYLSLLLAITTTQGMYPLGYLKSFFQEPPCLEGNPENTKLYEELKQAVKEGKLKAGRIMVILYKSEGKATCVLSKLGQEEKAGLYAQITNLITESKKPSFFAPENLTNARGLIESARNCLQIIHLGSHLEAEYPEYKFAEKELQQLEAKQKELLREQESKQTKAKS